MGAMQRYRDSLCHTRMLEECRCEPKGVWEREGVIIVYPKSGLVVVQGLLLRYTLPTRALFGVHRLERVMEFQLYYFVFMDQIMLNMRSNADGTYWSVRNRVDGVGLGRIRQLQRWWRERRRAFREARLLAFMMGAHKRIGAVSRVRAVDESVLRVCCSFF